MVGFGKRIQDNQVPEWSTEYLPYKKLKKLLKALVRKVSNEEGAVERQHASSPPSGQGQLTSDTVRKRGGLITVRTHQLSPATLQSHPPAARAPTRSSTCSSTCCESSHTRTHTTSVPLPPQRPSVGKGSLRRRLPRWEEDTGETAQGNLASTCPSGIKKRRTLSTASRKRRREAEHAQGQRRGQRAPAVSSPRPWLGPLLWAATPCWRWRMNGSSSGSWTRLCDASSRSTEPDWRGTFSTPRAFDSACVSASPLSCIHFEDLAAIRSGQ